MAIKTLKPIRETPATYDRIEAAIDRLFREEIYKPILREIGPNDGRVKIQNSYYGLLRAVQDGRITYYRGHFKGKFSASISKELKKLGAKWDRKTESFKLPSSKLPLDVKMAISVSANTFNQLSRRLDEFLSKLSPKEIAEKLNVTKLIEPTLFKQDQDIASRIKSISVQPKLKEVSYERISETYNQNMQRYVQKWTEEEITKLREQVAQNVLSGQRYEGLAKQIQASYGVSKNKAKFLARQETALYMAAFRRERYSENGITEYFWRNTGGHEVRHDHKLLNGTRQRYDSPPVTNQKNGARNNPGEDFGCLCLDEPIVEF